jgi:hypothetical protein
VTEAKCALCGEPMPSGEEMFKYHGLSGPCPKPPLPKPTIEALAEIVHRQTDDGEFWLEVRVNGKPWGRTGPFASTDERQRATDDLLSMLRSSGSKDIPAGLQ